MKRHVQTDQRLEQNNNAQNYKPVVVK